MDYENGTVFLSLASPLFYVLLLLVLLGISRIFALVRAV
jgi:hypothetical protein